MNNDQLRFDLPEDEPANPEAEPAAPEEVFGALSVDEAEPGPELPAGSEPAPEIAIAVEAPGAEPAGDVDALEAEAVYKPETPEAELATGTLIEAVEAEPEADEAPFLPAAQPQEPYDLPQALMDAGIDVDAALGALSFELSAGVGEEPTPRRPVLPPYTPSNYRPKLAAPAPIRLSRGSLGSVVPALILIGVGVWLTFANATGQPAGPALVGLVLVGGLVLSFAAQWLAGGRWSRGLLLIVLTILLGAGGAALVLQSGAVSPFTAYPLLLSAFGLAIILSALLARPVERLMLGPGLVFITAGIVGYWVLAGVIPESVLSTASAYWFVPAAIVALLLLLPLIFRRPTA